MFIPAHVPDHMRYMQRQSFRPKLDTTENPAVLLCHTESDKHHQRYHIRGSTAPRSTWIASSKQRVLGIRDQIDGGLYVYLVYVRINRARGLSCWCAALATSIITTAASGEVNVAHPFGCGRLVVMISVSPNIGCLEYLICVSRVHCWLPSPVVSSNQKWPTLILLKKI